MKRILILGSGFAGVWAAIGAARRLDELTDAGDIEILLVSRNSFHDIRVRNYELDLTPSRIPLSKILDPVGVKHQIGEIRGINVDTHTVEMAAASGSHAISYDRLVIALGSVLYRPDIPGLREFSFDIDTFDNATRLNAHLIDVARAPVRPESATVVVIGAGLTGIEAATEMPAKLDAAWAGVANAPPQRVIVLDHSPRVGSNMGDSAVPVIKKALDSQGIESVTGAQVAMISQNGITLSTGAFIPAATVVWCGGMRANPLNAQLGVKQDVLGRVTVDDYLRVAGVKDVFAAGDVALARMDDTHHSVMSCQHGRPMGRFVGYNVVSDVCGEPMKAFRIPWYVTVLDLGRAGAVYTEGWERQVVSTGDEAKATKTIINHQRIYPPLDGDRAHLFAAAAPIVQKPPAYGSDPNS